MSESFVPKPDNGPHSALNGLGVLASERGAVHRPGDHPGDWPEDFPHENGCYMNRCVGCGLIFHGHKRRAVCKVCTPKGESAAS